MNNTTKGLGRRKTAIAHVQLVSDVKESTVNGLPVETYFSTFAQKQAALAPLLLVSKMDTLAFKAKVSGGGKRAQADAVKLGIARALLTVDASWRKQLKEAGMLTRDPRMKERKKYGLKRARRAPQFSKR